jgi:hypothetical protein
MPRPVPERDDDGSVDVEAAWADIVAHWDDSDAPVIADSADGPTPPHPQLDADQAGDSRAAEQPPRPKPASDEQSPAQQSPAEQSPVQQSPAQQGGDQPTSRERADHVQADDDWDVPRSRVGGERAREAAERDAEAGLDDERYHPPEPPPLPRGDMVSRFAWGGVLGAPLFFLLAALFWHSAPTWLVMGAVAAFIAGFVTLVVRMPDHRDDDDDGAVV